MILRFGVTALTVKLTVPLAPVSGTLPTMPPAPRRMCWSPVLAPEMPSEAALNVALSTIWFTSIGPVFWVEVWIVVNVPLQKRFVTSPAGGVLGGTTLAPFWSTQFSGLSQLLLPPVPSHV